MPNPNEVSQETLDQLADTSEVVKAGLIKEAEFEEVEVADEKVTLPPPNAKDPKEYTEEELAQYEAMIKTINKMSLKQLQAWQRKANDRKKPQKEKALAKRRKAAKAKKSQLKHMKARGRKKK